MIWKPRPYWVFLKCHILFLHIAFLWGVFTYFSKFFFLFSWYPCCWQDSLISFSRNIVMLNTSHWSHHSDNESVTFPYIELPPWDVPETRDSKFLFSKLKCKKWIPFCVQSEFALYGMRHTSSCSFSFHSLRSTTKLAKCKFQTFIIYIDVHGVHVCDFPTWGRIGTTNYILTPTPTPTPRRPTPPLITTIIGWWLWILSRFSWSYLTRYQF